MDHTCLIKCLCLIPFLNHGVKLLILHLKKIIITIIIIIIIMISSSSYHYLTKPDEIPNFTSNLNEVYGVCGRFRESEKQFIQKVLIICLFTLLSCRMFTLFQNFLINISYTSPYLEFQISLFKIKKFLLCLIILPILKSKSPYFASQMDHMYEGLDAGSWYSLITKNLAI